MAEIATWQIKIYTNWKRYKKLIPVTVGVGLLILFKYLDIDVPGFAAVVLDLFISAGAVFGVYQVKNEPKTEAITIDTEVKKVG